MKRVLVNAPLGEEQLQQLRQHTEIVAVDEGDISGHIDRYAPFEAIIASAVIPLDGPLLDRIAGLEVIGRLGAGVDNVDIDAATRRGIVVVHTPDAPTQSTAEHAVALLLAAAKDLVHQDSALRAGNWQVRHERVGRDFHGQTLGLVGIGRIGTRVVELLRPFELRCLAYDPFVDPEDAAAIGAELLPELDELLPQVDFLTLHLPLNDQTRNLIGRQALAMMKPTAWLVNTSRGGVVNEAHLIEALRAGTIAGAAVDVFDPEPPQPDHPLFELSNVIVTPHRAFYTVDGLRRLSQSVVDQVLTALRGDRPESLVNPTVWEHARCRRKELEP